MICRFQLAIGPVRGVGPMVEAAVGQWTTKPFVEEQKDFFPTMASEEGSVLIPEPPEVPGVGPAAALQA